VSNVVYLGIPSSADASGRAQRGAKANTAEPSDKKLLLIALIQQSGEETIQRLPIQKD
jgi:hypothetical protein